MSYDSYDRGPKMQVKVLPGVFGSVVQRVGPVMKSKRGGLRVQAIVVHPTGDLRRTAHLHKAEGGRWLMYLGVDEKGREVLGEVTYDGK